jgi:lipopolysaccharide export system protein LptC
MSLAATLSPWMRARRLWDRLGAYLPIVLMAVLALASYWLVRLAPQIGGPELEPAPRHVPDYFMRDFSVRVFDVDGKLKSELLGKEGRHYPDTDTVEIDDVRVRSFSKDGRVTTARAVRGLSNADGSEVQLFGNAIVVREAFVTAQGQEQPRSEIRSEFLHLFADTEAIRTHLPVELLRGSGDRFTADRMDYDNLDRIMQLKGRVRGTIQPRQKAP